MCPALHLVDVGDTWFSQGVPSSVWARHGRVCGTNAGSSWDGSATAEPGEAVTSTPNDCRKDPTP